MNPRKARALCLALFLPVLSVPAFALPGDAAAILAHCGPPSSDQVLHQGTAQAERVISYSDTELIFAPEGGDWSFASARRATIPLQQEALVGSMHCVGDALEEVSARPVQGPGATMPASDSTADTSPNHDGLFLWGVCLVFVGVIFFAIRPYTKRREIKPAAPVIPRAPQRRPSATGVKFRKPESLDVSGPPKAS